jgi:hypothetical protein
MAIWKFMNIGKANAEIQRLELLLNVPESDRRAFTTFNIAKANKLVTELESKLSERPTPLQGSSESVPPARAHAAAPPGGPAIPVSLPAALSAGAAAPAAEFQWDTESLSALVDATFGKGTAREICHEPISFDTGAWKPASAYCSDDEQEANSNARLSAEAADVEAGRKIHSVHAMEQGRKDREAKTAKAVADRDAKVKANSFNKLRGFLLSHQIRVPCLSYAGLPVLDREFMSAKQVAEAQRRASIFCGVIAGLEESAFDNSSVAEMARRFLVNRAGRGNDHRSVAFVGEKMQVKKV